MRRRGVDIDNYQIADLGLFANPDREVKLITFHNAKGREFDAAALVSVNEGKIPHFSARTNEEIEGGRRLFYIGISRAKKLLLIASDQMHHKDTPTRFIRECGIARSA